MRPTQIREFIMRKLFTLLLAVAASVGTMFAEKVQIGDLYYNLDATSQTAEVTSQNRSYPYWSTTITTAIIPASVEYNSVTYSVTSIGNWAFINCRHLTSVTIGNSVTSIGEYAFSGCSGLTSVTIPNSVTSIGEAAFSGCSGLTSVTIPNSVTSIGRSAFDGCTGLTSIVVENGNTVYDCRDNCNAIIETATNTLIGGCQNTIIPNSVTSIGEYAFYNCTSLTSVTIPNSVTSIGEYAFSYCSVLTSIDIPNSVTSIGNYAFCNCSGLTSMTIPNSVTSIGNNAFLHCDSLSTIVAPALLFNNAGSTFGFTSYAFEEMISQISHLTINGGTLTQYAFDQIHISYRKLEAIDLSVAENTEIPDEAFKGCYNLKTLKLPAGLTQIGYMATAECVNLESIAIPASVEEIGDRAFEDCRSLQSITFGGSANPAPGRFNAPAAASQLKRIGNWAFYNAHELQNLEIPEGVEEIGDGAFYGCTYMEDLVLPSSVRAIGDNCFALCAKLKKIVVNSVTPPTIQAKTFYDVKRQIPVYVPDEAVSSYEGDAYWQEFDIQGASKMPQDIDQVPSDQVQCTKVVRNGQILILRGDKTYTITGAEMR